MPRRFTIDRGRAEAILTARDTAFEAARQAGAEAREIVERIAGIEATHRSRTQEAGGRYSPPVSDLEKIALLRGSIPAAKARHAAAGAIAQQTGRLASAVEEIVSPRRSLAGIEVARSL
jgi:hypothetical protein